MHLLLTAVTLTLSGSLVVLTAQVLWAHYRAWRLAPPPDRAIPLHVWLVASSYLALVCLLLLGGLSGSSDLGDWRAALRVPALALGVAGMFVLANFQRKTYPRGRR